MVKDKIRNVNVAARGWSVTAEICIICTFQENPKRLLLKIQIEHFDPFDPLLCEQELIDKTSNLHAVAKCSLM